MNSIAPCKTIWHTHTHTDRHKPARWLETKKEVLQYNKAKQRVQTLLWDSGALGARCSTALKLVANREGGLLVTMQRRGGDRKKRGEEIDF